MTWLGAAADAAALLSYGNVPVMNCPQMGLL
jgi:hypothetical protein